MRIDRFEDLEAWKLARELTQEVYRVSANAPFPRDFGLADQVRRAAGSVMHNTAEGYDAGSNAEFIKFLRYAQRSVSEVQSQLYIALDQSYVSAAQFEALFQLTQKTESKVGGFIAYLQRSTPS